MRSKHGARHVYGKNKRRRAGQLLEARTKSQIIVAPRVDSDKRHSDFDSFASTSSSGDQPVEENITTGDSTGENSLPFIEASRSDIKLSKFKTYEKSQVDDVCKPQWMLIDIRQINMFFQEIECPSCCEHGSLSFEKSDNFDRFGFAVNLILKCGNCEMCVDKNYTSPRSGNQSGDNSFQVNDIFMLFLSEVGLGYRAMKKFCMVFGMEGLHGKTFQHKQNMLSNVIIENTEEVLTQSVEMIRHAYGELQAVSDDVPLDITVSYDGTWQKRGHTSNYGVGAVIDVLTGLVIDYEVLSKYCHACAIHTTTLGEDTAEFRQWYEGHARQCCQNYEGSSNAMEVEAAKRLWARSLEKHNLRYVCLLSDGDAKTHVAVNEIQPYGPDVSIKKEDCINHAHKRMGTALLNRSREQKLGGKGKGKLSKEKALKLQYYYRFAITNNVGNIEGMRNAVWATLFHCMSTDDAPHHSRCPTGPTSWCFYNKALANDLEPPTHEGNIRHFLDAQIAEQMVPVYQRMSDENLLKRLIKGKTQNANECLHSVIWSRCPKTVFVGKRQLHRAVASAVASFNEGTVHVSQVMNKLAMEANELTAASIESLDKVRILKARKQSQLTSKVERSKKWEAKKRDRVRDEAVEGLLYGAGEF